MIPLSRLLLFSATAALSLAAQPVAVPRVAAATVVLSGTHMAARPGAARPATQHFPAATRAIYFDYQVRAPYDGDAGEVSVYRGGTTGKRLARAPLVFSLQGSLYVRLLPKGKTWGRGGYCTVLTIDGQVETAGGKLPLAWSVGGARLPSCPRP